MENNWRKLAKRPSTRGRCCHLDIRMSRDVGTYVISVYIFFKRFIYNCKYTAKLTYCQQSERLMVTKEL